MMDTRIRAVVLGLITRAKNGSLAWQELRELWPAEASLDPFLSRVYIDLDEAVIHLPARRGGKIDLDVFHGFWEHTVLGLDACLIESGRDTDQLLRCRQKAQPREIEGLTEVEVARWVSECLGDDESENGNAPTTSPRS